MKENNRALYWPIQIGANQLTAEQKAGMQLARSLLWMMAGAIILYALICMEHGCSQRGAPALSVAKFPAAPNGQLDFALRNLQFVMHVLLPVFTTVLGYFFGTKSRG